MEHKKLNRIIAGIVFLISITVLAITTQTSIPFWDCGESSASAYLLQVPHPPGSPTHMLIGRVVSMLPFFEIAFRLNFISAFAGALSVTLIYLSSVILITAFRGLPKTLSDKLIVYGSSAIGALAFSFSDSFWFIAVESTHFSLSLFLLIFVFWLALHWSVVYENDDRSEHYFILIGYLFGLAIGVHQLSLLAFFSVAMIYYFKKFEFSPKSFTIFALVSVLIFVLIYKGIFVGVPDLLGSSSTRILALFLFLILLYGIYYSYKHKKGYVNFALVSVLLIILGYSTYTTIVIRANKGLAMNENNPNTFDKLVHYLGREQYGDWPVINFDKEKWDGKLFPRRWTNEDYRVARFKEYKSDWDYFVKYQFYNMWFRYLLWNYVGRAGDVQDAPPAWFGKTDPQWVGKPGSLPDKYFAIPFIIGLFGAFYHFYKDKKLGFAVLSLFIVTGFGLMFYQNMQNPQPRERDYFFVGSFYVYAMWIGIGISGILDWIKKSLKSLNNVAPVLIGSLAVFAIAVPGNLVIQNFDNHNRNGNYLAWDFSYNILQSCPKDAVLVTVGDNDTFPLWYLQDVEGVRRDVRIVNMSLINTDWYPLQMKNETPYGTKKVPFNYTDEQIEKITSQFNEFPKEQVINLPVPKEVYQKFQQEESDLSKEYHSYVVSYTPEMLDPNNCPEKISFTMKAQYQIPDQRSGRTVYGVRAQDLFVLDIVKANNWERPICFSITASPDSKIGLDDYLRMEGMVYRLTPFKQGGSRGEYLNGKLMYEQLMKEPAQSSTEPQVGLRFRNLNNPGLYLDENAIRMAKDYRILFFNLASHFIGFKDTTRAYEVLQAMEKKISPVTVGFDYRMKYNLILFYSEIGKKDDVFRIANDLEKDCLQEIEHDPSNIKQAWNPYRILLEVYDMTGRVDKEIEILTKISVQFPGDQSIKDRINQLRNMKSADTVKK
jgi:hypothetical protein